jgi:small subunit ribosomal protein S6
MAAPRQYELVYIAAPDSTEEQVADLHAQVEAIVARFGGRIETTENWGRRKLAYEISRQREGIYVLEIIHGSGELVKELDRRLRVIDTVIRHLIVRVDEELRVAERARVARKAHVERRRAARGVPAAAEGEEPAHRDTGSESSEVEA